MQLRRLAVEALENRTLLAGDTAAVLPEEPLPGDANMDGTFDQSDLIQVLEAGKYATGQLALWSEGDWNGDGTSDKFDVISALRTGRYKAPDVERPFKGSVAGEVTFVPDAACPNFDGLRTDSAATGTASHLGRTSMTSQHCTPAGAEITGGKMTLVAANGDELYIEYSGTSIPGDVIVVDVDFEIIDGTGRFEGAQGGGDMTADVVFAGFEVPVWPASWVWEGTIRY